MTEGIILLNKPIDATSFDCIRHFKRLLPRRTKIGHTGTLDPFATGLLIVCIGRAATKQISTFMALPKTYTATATLNMVTDTLDHTGTPVPVPPGTMPTTAALTTALASLMPTYTQTPPAYSALKHNGTPLYKLARTNALTDQDMATITAAKQRTVTLYNATFDAHTDSTFTVTATVSQGTYIRTLMHDIAQLAGATGATTTALTRSAIGPFTMQQAATLHDITPTSLATHLQPLDAVLPVLAAYKEKKEG